MRLWSFVSSHDLQAVAVVQVVRRAFGHHAFLMRPALHAGAAASASRGLADAAAGARRSDLTYAISCSSCSSVTSPWNVGMIGWKPATIFACGFRIDSRM